MRDGRVEGKVAFVTGAARGQGRSHAVRLAEEGADIIAVDICEDIASTTYRLSRREELHETARLVEGLGRRAVTFRADVRERAQLHSVLESGVGQLGRLDVVVAQAGIMPMFSALGIQAWIDVIDVNMVGTINAIHAALPYLTEGASIIATGSAAAFMPYDIEDNPGADPGGSGYGVAKIAVASYIHDLARALAPRMIRVNAVHPTNCNTAMLQSEAMYQAFRPDLENPTMEDATTAFVTQQAFPIPWVEPQDVSHAVVYLASDESRYVTGTQMRVDAGSYLKFHAFHA